MNFDAICSSNPSKIKIVQVRIDSGIKSVKQSRGYDEKLPRDCNADITIPQKASKHSMGEPFVKGDHPRKNRSVVAPIHDAERDDIIATMNFCGRPVKDFAASVLIDAQIRVANANKVRVH